MVVRQPSAEDIVHDAVDDGSWVELILLSFHCFCCRFRVFHWPEVENVWQTTWSKIIAYGLRFMVVECFRALPLKEEKLCSRGGWFLLSLHESMISVACLLASPGECGIDLIFDF